jgi:hypothetical protein
LAPGAWWSDLYLLYYLPSFSGAAQSAALIGLHLNARDDENGHKGWQLVSAFTSPHVCGDGESYATDFRLPESITGPTFRAHVLRRLLKSIRKQGIHAGEYLLTPDAGLLVAVSNLLFDEAIQEFCGKRAES